MKRKMKKKLIAFMLCMVLVICNSVSILADTPAAATTTAENQVSETKTAKNEKSSEENKSTDDNDTSKQSEETDESKDEAPEATTTEKKEETTEATTEEKEDATTATTEAEEPTTEATTEDKATTEASDETSESDEKKEATTAETSSETSGTTEETTEAADETTMTAEGDETTAATELKYEDEQVLITVTANEENAIPAGAALKVVPILKNDTATQAQYTEVEKQLKDKSEKEDYTTLGFLAYDITFTDAQGNEIEPNGQVVVNMSYKKAVLPSGIEATDEEIADANVAVLHLEEDANKQVQNVADLSENNQLQNIELTDSNEVTQAEFVTESFSVFVLEWNNDNTLKVNIVDNNGNNIDVSQRELEDSQIIIGSYEYHGQTKYIYADGFDFTNQNAGYKTITDQNGNDYSFIKAVVINNVNDYPKNNLGTDITKIYRDNSGYHYIKTEDGTAQNYVYGNKLLFVYGKVEQLETIQTIDNNEYGITMTMKNYKSAANGLDNALGGQYQNRDSWPYKKGQVWQGLVNPILQKDDEGNYTYPKTDGYNGSSLESLFNGQEVNKLFSQKEYEDTGYFEYSSFDNYAYLNGNEFEVYKQLGTPTNEYAYFYQRGNFMPYNPIFPGKFSSNTNLYDKDGNNLPTTDARYNEPLYKTQSNGHTDDGNNNDFYFGMSLEAKFTQPKDGKVEHNGIKSNMRYEFNGDDDLWVFIDGVLVLDIGGEHDAHSGYIDFATGQVYVDLGNGVQNTTIKEMFSKAGVFPDGTSWTKDTSEKQVNEYFDGDTFKDYTIHDMKMFYMERGAGASNLYMRFNLQTIPDGTIQVGKNISNSDKEKYANVQFAFQVYVQKQISEDEAGNPKYSNTGDKEQDYVLVDGSNYSVKKNGTGTSIEVHDSVQIDGKTYNNVFYLKPEEVANISKGQLELKQNQKYYVVEVGVQSEEYDKVQINGIDVKDEDGNYITGSVETPIKEIGELPTVYYTNNCSAENSKELQITSKR